VTASAADRLRPPSRLDPSAAAYKDWLHLNVLDHRSGAIGLVNVSLHGDPADPRSRAVGTALVHVPHVGWVGNVEVAGLDSARIDVASIALEHVAIAVDRDAVLASVHLPDDELTLDLSAAFASPPIVANEAVPFGTSWIGWFAVPRLRLAGGGRAAGVELDLDGAGAYHDHNWGRWHWGDDFGWEWGCFLASDPAAPAFVLSGVTDRAHRRSDPSLHVAGRAGKRRRFSGAALEVSWSGRLAPQPRRLPGAVAALHHDRSSPRIPGRLEVVAGDGAGRVELEFEARAAAQLVAADPARRGYGFVHELVGPFRYAGALDGVEAGGSGLAVVEYVD
jgi:hypothetical protein